MGMTLQDVCSSYDSILIDTCTFLGYNPRTKDDQLEVIEYKKQNGVFPRVEFVKSVSDLIEKDYFIYTTEYVLNELNPEKDEKYSFVKDFESLLIEKKLCLNGCSFEFEEYVDNLFSESILERLHGTDKNIFTHALEKCCEENNRVVMITSDKGIHEAWRYGLKNGLYSYNDMIMFERVTQEGFRIVNYYK